MLELLTSAHFFWSLSAAPKLDIPRHLPGWQIVFTNGQLTNEEYTGMPCPYNIPEMFTVYDTASDLCFYITEDQIMKLPHSESFEEKE